MARVFIGLSGGVDSAVSAALLKEQGHDVVGAFIKIWQPEFIECTWEKDRLDAMRVCVALGIHFREVDLSDEYKRDVIRDMVEGYQKGMTPNPDVLCNAKIKFGSFAEWARSEGAEMLATGHYARIEKQESGYALLRGIDLDKDQSYFLWQLAERDLGTIYFPVGAMRKADVRAHAKRLNIPVARKPDSQGLCFVGDITLPEFLAHYVQLTPGKVLNEEGRVIGEHGGVAQYTIGQRHGFTIHNHGDERPHYVVELDAEKNTITVSPEREDAASRSVLISDVNDLGGLRACSRGDVQVRYRGKPVGAQCGVVDDAMQITFDSPLVAAPGQSLVCYRGDRVLGGGVIQAVR